MKAIEVTKDNFVRYGQFFFDINSKAPFADNAVVTCWDKACRFDIATGEVSMSYLVGKKIDGPYTEIERHMLTNEVIVALDRDVVFLVAVGQPESEEIRDARIFKMKQGTGVVLNKGVWHGIPRPIEGEEAHLLILFRNNTETEDLYQSELREPVEVEV